MLIWSQSQDTRADSGHGAGSGEAQENGVESASASSDSGRGRQRSLLANSDGGLSKLWQELRVAVERGPAGSAQRAAEVLRRFLRTHPEASREADALLLAADIDADARVALAWVLGSLPGHEAALLEALDSFGEDESIAPFLLLALGAEQETLDDDAIFDMAERPFGEQGPAGLGIVVRRKIQDAAVRARLAHYLLDKTSIESRRAAVVALRASLDSQDTRNAFLRGLATETSDRVATELGEPLALFALASTHGRESNDLVSAILLRAEAPALEGYRFRIEDEMRRLRLDESHWKQLLDLSLAGRTAEVRGFSLSLLAQNPSPRSTATREAIDALLQKTLSTDPETWIRARAARLMAKLPATTANVSALERAATSDSAWNVRLTAMNTLALLAAAPALRRILPTLANNANTRVAARARELLKALGR